MGFCFMWMLSIMNAQAKCKFRVSLLDRVFEHLSEGLASFYQGISILMQNTCPSSNLLCHLILWVVIDSFQSFKSMVGKAIWVCTWTSLPTSLAAVLICCQTVAHAVPCVWSACHCSSLHVHTGTSLNVKYPTCVSRFLQPRPVFLSSELSQYHHASLMSLQCISVTVVWVWGVKLGWKSQSWMWIFTLMVNTV